MDELLQGTTPYLLMGFDGTGLDVADITAAELTIASGRQKFTKALADMTADTSENTLSYHFTESETLLLSTTAAVSWQLFVSVDGEIYGTKAERLAIFEKKKGEAMA